MQLRWTEPAARDLDAIAAFYQQEAGARVAAANILRIIAAVKILLAAPHQSRPGRIPGTRELVINGMPYLVPYRVVGEEIQILRVFHTAQNPHSQW